MDQELDKVVENMPEIEVNTSAAQEKIGEIKCGVRFIKERCPNTQAIMTFK